jgi:hypothetical protein
MFMFCDLLGIPEVLSWRKPACLELFGLRIGRWGRGNLVERVFLRNGGLFWIPALYPGFRSVNSGVHPLKYLIT